MSDPLILTYDKHPRDLWQYRYLTIVDNFWQFLQFLTNFENDIIFCQFLQFWRILTILMIFYICWKILTILDNFNNNNDKDRRPLWPLRHWLQSDNWEPEFMSIFVTWQLRVTLDSICNSTLPYNVNILYYTYFPQQSPPFAGLDFALRRTVDYADSQL